MKPALQSHKFLRILEVYANIMDFFLIHAAFDAIFLEDGVALLVLKFMKIHWKILGMLPRICVWFVISM